MVFGAQPTYEDMFRFANSNPLTCCGRLVALSNSDVVLRHAERLDPRAFDYRAQWSHYASAAAPLSESQALSPPPRPLAYVLSVQPVPNSCGRNKDYCIKFRKAGVSWDIHVFMTPLRDPSMPMSPLSTSPLKPASPKLTTFPRQHSFGGAMKNDTLDFSLLEGVFMNMMGAENRAGFFLHSAGYELRNPCAIIVAEHWHCAQKTHALRKPPGKNLPYRGHKGGGGGASVVVRPGGRAYATVEQLMAAHLKSAGKAPQASATGGHGTSAASRAYAITLQRAKERKEAKKSSKSKSKSNKPSKRKSIPPMALPS